VNVNRRILIVKILAVFGLAFAVELDRRSIVALVELDVADSVYRCTC
jgi:hypothetical protein